MENPFEKLNARLMNLESVYLKIDERLKDALELIIQPSDNSEQYYTKKELCKKLKISIVCLHNWEKRGVINRVEFGGIPRYRLSDIEKIISNPKK